MVWKKNSSTHRSWRRVAQLSTCACYTSEAHGPGFGGLSRVEVQLSWRVNNLCLAHSITTWGTVIKLVMKSGSWLGWSLLDMMSSNNGLQGCNRKSREKASLSFQVSSYCEFIKVTCTFSDLGSAPYWRQMLMLGSYVEALQRPTLFHRIWVWVSSSYYSTTEVERCDLSSLIEYIYRYVHVYVVGLPFDRDQGFGLRCA